MEKEPVWPGQCISKLEHCKQFYDIKGVLLKVMAEHRHGLGSSVRSRAPASPDETDCRKGNYLADANEENLNRKKYPYIHASAFWTFISIILVNIGLELERRTSLTAKPRQVLDTRSKQCAIPLSRCLIEQISTKTVTIKLR